MSRLPLIITLLVLVAIISGFVLIWQTRRDVLPTRINATFNQLRNVHASIEQKFFEEFPRSISLAEAKQSLLQKNGANYLRSEVDRKQELIINPHLENWTNQNFRSREIAIISPVAFPDSVENRNYYIGITFSGERTNLNFMPNW